MDAANPDLRDLHTKLNDGQQMVNATAAIHHQMQRNDLDNFLMNHENVISFQNQEELDSILTNNESCNGGTQDATSGRQTHRKQQNFMSFQNCD